VPPAPTRLLRHESPDRATRPDLAVVARVSRPCHPPRPKGSFLLYRNDMASRLEADRRGNIRLLWPRFPRKMRSRTKVSQVINALEAEKSREWGNPRAAIAAPNPSGARWNSRPRLRQAKPAAGGCPAARLSRSSYFLRAPRFDAVWRARRNPPVFLNPRIVLVYAVILESTYPLKGILAAETHDGLRSSHRAQMSGPARLKIRFRLGLP
jgi:hypothetical protein